MYSIIVILNTGEEETINTIDVKDTEFPHIKYLEALKSAEELFDRHVITSYVVNLFEYKAGGKGSNRSILKHSQKANVH